MTSEARSERLQQRLPLALRNFKSILLIGGILLIGILFYVWQHIQVVRFGYQIERLRAEQLRLVQETKAMRVELARLRSLRRVEEVVRRELGMVPASPGQIILMEEARRGG
jgi:hypothetical protein